MSAVGERTQTEADLEHWQPTGTALAVLGHPIGHSVSPPMHNAALAELARAEPAFSSWRYHRFDIAPERLAEALAAFHRQRFLGLNLTIPHKVIAVGLVRRIDPFAAEAGAVNTLRRLDDGGYEGFNSDGYGIEQAIAEELDASFAGADVILLGAGGAARATAVACLRGGCRSLWIGNRTASKLEALLASLRPIAAETGGELHGFLTTGQPPSLPADALVINATSAGLNRDDPPPIDLDAAPGRPRIYDMIYNPPVTPLLGAASARGLRAANGLSMLVHQGARSLEIWSGRRPSTAVMRRACLAALGSASPGL